MYIIYMFLLKISRRLHYRKLYKCIYSFSEDWIIQPSITSENKYFLNVHENKFNFYNFRHGAKIRIPKVFIIAFAMHIARIKLEYKKYWGIRTNLLKYGNVRKDPLWIRWRKSAKFGDLHSSAIVVFIFCPNTRLCRIIYFVVVTTKEQNDEYT